MTLPTRRGRFGLALVAKGRSVTNSCCAFYGARPALLFLLLLSAVLAAYSAGHFYATVHCVATPAQHCTSDEITLTHTSSYITFTASDSLGGQVVWNADKTAEIYNASGMLMATVRQGKLTVKKGFTAKEVKDSVRKLAWNLYPPATPPKSEGRIGI